MVRKRSSKGMLASMLEVPNDKWVLNKKNLQSEDVEAVIKGSLNLKRHIENIQKFGLPLVVAINHFVADTEKEIQAVKDECKKLNIEYIIIIFSL